MGGLGNQMFQYAFGRRMAIINNTQLVLDCSLLLDKSQPHELVTHRDFELDIFNLQEYRWATKEEIFDYNGNPKAFKVKKIIRKIRNTFYPKRLVIQQLNEFNETYLSIKEDVCFVGRWQSELYFKDISEQIKKDFSITVHFNEQIKLYANKIQMCNAVCLHVRRGDLITSVVYSSTIGVINIDYYNVAINYIKQQINNPVFFVFSDDIDWCKKNVILQDQTYYMDDTTSGKKAEGHLFLMKQCKHFIISNSTYAWWGAWLSDYNQKIVVYPANWYKDEEYNNKKMCPSSWICF